MLFPDNIYLVKQFFSTFGYFHRYSWTLNGISRKDLLRPGDKNMVREKERKSSQTMTVDYRSTFLLIVLDWYRVSVSHASVFFIILRTAYKFTDFFPILRKVFLHYND
jgi:hypothetical protein